MIVNLITLLAIIYVIYNMLKYYNILSPSIDENLPRILLYHSIGQGKETTLNISSKKFTEQIKYLIDNDYKFYTISELVDLQLKDPNNKGKKVAITIDDGYENNYHNAFKILKKHQAKATIYIAPEIKNLKKLNEKQIIEMHKSGLIEFGAHTMTHIRLTENKNNVCQKEIKDSKIYLENLLKTKCKSFAYPYGDFNAEHVELCKKLCFQSATTCEEKISQISKDNLFLIPRTCIRGRKNMFKFKIALLKGCYRLKKTKNVY
ncbi:MAG: polysaccharide deacetylase family protein [Rickettsiales bacterium]|nr:polysaccharide deacetylase family protein [Rickettsiales bacterium]